MCPPLRATAQSQAKKQMSKNTTLDPAKVLHMRTSIDTWKDEQATMLHSHIRKPRIHALIRFWIGRRNDTGGAVPKECHSLCAKRHSCREFDPCNSKVWQFNSRPQVTQACDGAKIMSRSLVKYRQDSNKCTRWRGIGFAYNRISKLSTPAVRVQTTDIQPLPKIKLTVSCNQECLRTNPPQLSRTFAFAIR